MPSALPMNAIALHPTPRLPTVVAEHLRTVGMALRREALLVLLLVLAIDAGALVLGGQALGEAGLDPSAFHPEGRIVLALLGFALPFALWRDQSPFAGGPMWNLPVERFRHALVRVFAGWCWLMGATVFVLGWLALGAFLTGGSFGIDETRLVMEPRAPGAALAFTPVHWTTPAWQWLVPLASTTVPYLLGTALLLGVRHPWRLIFALTLLFGLAAFDVGGIGDLLQDWLAKAVGGTYGLENALTGTPRNFRIASGEDIWTGLPAPGFWLRPYALWLLASLALVGLAAWRHRD